MTKGGVGVGVGAGVSEGDGVDVRFISCLSEEGRRVGR